MTIRLWLDHGIHILKPMVGPWQERLKLGCSNGSNYKILGGQHFHKLKQTRLGWLAISFDQSWELLDQSSCIDQLVLVVRFLV